MYRSYSVQPQVSRLQYHRPLEMRVVGSGPSRVSTSLGAWFGWQVETQSCHLPETMEHEIYCIPPYSGLSFPVNILLTWTVGELKKAIRDEIPDQVGGCPANGLKLYLYHRRDRENQVELVNPYLELSDVFGHNGPLKACVLGDEHIGVRLPNGESVDSALGRFPDVLHIWL